MQRTTLRKVGGSVMLSVPPALLDVLSLSAGAEVGLTVVDGQLVVKPVRKKKYTLAELLAESDYSTPPSPEEREWLDAPPVGRELL
jgi:antitoxin ChpS